MNKSILSFGSALFLLCAGTQAQASDSVETGKDYSNQVFYSLETGSRAAAPNTNWDIAFQIEGFSASILINDGNGAELMRVPDSTPESWAQPLDTNGMSTWKKWNNSTQTWNAGAFNMDSDFNTGDFGWGEYSMITHTVSGKTLFVVKLPNGSYKKIFIDGLAGGVYNFRHADLDGGNEVQASLDKKDFIDKNFGYYSITDNKVLDREPVSTAWDLTFGKYIDYVVAGPGAPMPYAVTGVRLNAEVLAAKVTDVPVEESVAPEESAFTDIISTIGYDWKTFNMSTMTYDISPTTSYFVRSQAGNLYKIVFTGFTGSSTGRFIFETTKLESTSVGEGSNTVVMALHPNTVATGENTQLVFSVDTPVAQASIAVYDLAGREQLRRALPSGVKGLQSVDLQTSSLRSGMYVVVLHMNGTTAYRHLLVY